MLGEAVSGDRVAKLRFAKACASIAVLLAVIVPPSFFWPLFGEDTDFLEGPEGTHAARVSDLLSASLDGKGVGPVLSGYGIGRVSASDVPDWFEEEVVSLEGFDEVYANEDFSLVGFHSREDQAKAASSLCETLVSKGWIGIDSGYEGLIAFTKKEGACTWAMIECVPGAKGTDVVLLTRRS